MRVQASSESDVIDAVLLWLEGDPEGRREHVYDLLQGVRLGELGLLELGRLQQNPMVRAGAVTSVACGGTARGPHASSLTRAWACGVRQASEDHPWRVTDRAVHRSMPDSPRLDETGSYALRGLT